MYVKNSSFISILIDESNDISMTKNLILYVQYLSKNPVSPQVKFLKNIPLVGCDAESIASVIHSFFEEKGIDMNKLVMLTSDGAAVMLGWNNGVHIKLRVFCPHLLEFHCVAHRETLAVGQAYQSIRYFVQMEKTIRAIYSHFSHSSVRLEKLKIVFSILEKKILRLKKLYDICWLSRVEAVDAVVKSYSALVVYFDEAAVGDSTSSGLLTQLKSFKFSLAIHFLLDVLGCLRQLNKTFQSTAFHPYDAQRKVAEVSNALKCHYITLPFMWGPNATEFLEQVNNGTSTVDFVYNNSEKSQVQKDCTDFIEGVLANLAARFPQSDLMKAVKIFDPSLLPPEKDLAIYGESEINMLAEHYSTFVNKSECRIEWDTVKQCISANYRKFKFREFLPKLAGLEEYQAQYPNLSSLAKIVLTYPASTAEVERGFSFQNATKTKVRNRLGPEHLDQLLRLQLNSPEEDNFPFTEAY